MKAVLLLLLCLSVAGCGAVRSVGDRLPSLRNVRGEAAEIDGLRFRSRLALTTPDRRGFAVTTRNAVRSVAAAKEAGRLRAVGHCLNEFGESEILWSRSPDRPVAEIALNGDGSLTLTGVCIAR